MSVLSTVLDRIIVRRVKAIEALPSGIVIPGESTIGMRGRVTNAQEALRPNEGEVIAIGSKVVDVSLGDVITWNGRENASIKLPGSDDLELIIEGQVMTRRRSHNCHSSCGCVKS